MINLTLYYYHVKAVCITKQGNSNQRMPVVSSIALRERTKNHIKEETAVNLKWLLVSLLGECQGRDSRMLPCCTAIWGVSGSFHLFLFFTPQLSLSAWPKLDLGPLCIHSIGMDKAETRGLRVFKIKDCECSICLC